jgi:hypothetical protein
MRSVTLVLAFALAATVSTAPRALAQGADDSGATRLTLVSAHVSLEGTSNVHDYTASTTAVRLEGIEVGGASTGDLLDDVLQPGALTAFEIVIAAASLASPREAIDKNMHKALKVEEFPDIRFRLRAFEPAGGTYQASGWLTIAGVEQEVTLDVRVQRTGTTLAVEGETELLMTDFGVTPPRAMLGMIRTNPRVQLRVTVWLRALTAERAGGSA